MNGDQVIPDIDPVTGVSALAEMMKPTAAELETMTPAERERAIHEVPEWTQTKTPS